MLMRIWLLVVCWLVATCPTFAATPEERVAESDREMAVALREKAPWLKGEKTIGVKAYLDLGGATTSLTVASLEAQMEAELQALGIKVVDIQSAKRTRAPYLILQVFGFPINQIGLVLYGIGLSLSDTGENTKNRALAIVQVWELSQPRLASPPAQASSDIQTR